MPSINEGLVCPVKRVLVLEDNDILHLARGTYNIYNLRRGDTGAAFASVSRVLSTIDMEVRAPSALNSYLAFPGQAGRSTWQVSNTQAGTELNTLPEAHLQIVGVLVCMHANIAPVHLSADGWSLAAPCGAKREVMMEDVDDDGCNHTWGALTIAAPLGCAGE